MKFGRTPLDQALGAVVGHTLRLGTTVIKKGRRLGERDLEALRAAGYDAVVAARIEEGDVVEDQAATRIAAAALGPGARAAGAATGRCNLHASADGIVRVDRARIDRINRVDEAVTIATLAPDAPVREGDMIATVKIIPYAVPRSIVEACESAARGDDPGDARSRGRIESAGGSWGESPGGPSGAVAVARFSGFAAGLVLTRLPGVHESVLDRAAAAQRVRAERLGGAITRELRCDHQEGEVAAAIAGLLDAGCAPVLLLGASAIADRHDVLPAAVELAGGTIEHFGMPVDPGNLLLLARRGGVTIVGVPGCARSLKRSGYDMVLERIAAGIAVTPDDLVGLGVGGLLAEIPPGPVTPGDAVEERAPDTGPRPAVAAILLAAGHSRRMGERNKLLVPVDGTAMVARVVDALLATPARPIVVVTGHDAEAVRRALAELLVRFVHNVAHETGMSSSLRAGIEALLVDAGGDPPIPVAATVPGTAAGAGAIQGALVCLGDMPRLQPAHIDALLAAFTPEWPPPGAAPDYGGRRPLCVPVFEGRRGNPVLFARRYFAELCALEGDVGARALIERHAGEVRRVPVGDDGVLLDVDTPETLLAITHKDE